LIRLYLLGLSDNYLVAVARVFITNNLSDKEQSL
jgi:hypothetical protein